MSSASDLFSQINNAVLDLQASDLQTFERPLKRLSVLLNHPTLSEINSRLKGAVDFETFIAKSEASAGGMVGSAKLAWPDEQEEYFGLALEMIDRLAVDDGYAQNIGFVYFYTNNKIMSGIHSMVRQFIIPFIRDYKSYVLSGGNVDITVKPTYSNKIFIVHGREHAPRESVARFLEKLAFQPIILNEQPNQGQTIIEKIETHSDVGFAVVLLTPDDEGCLKGEAPKPRARQNVMLELGYFIGKLSRKRVCTLKAGDVDIPSDWSGVVDEPYDAAGAWKATLARELQAAGYSIDWHKVMT